LLLIRESWGSLFNRAGRAYNAMSTAGDHLLTVYATTKQPFYALASGDFSLWLRTWICMSHMQQSKQYSTIRLRLHEVVLDHSWITRADDAMGHIINHLPRAHQELAKAEADTQYTYLKKAKGRSPRVIHRRDIEARGNQLLCSIILQWSTVSDDEWVSPLNITKRWRGEET
jgi:hypothetical protein